MLAGFLDRHADKAYAALRMVAGLLFSFHGMQKVLGWLPVPDHPPPEAWSQMWVGGMLELVCGLLIFAGLFTRLAAFVASGEMAVAYFQAHWKIFTPPFQWSFDGAFDDYRWVPGKNGGELAVLYCFLFLYIFFAGGRRCSIDRLWQRRRAPIAPAPATTSSYR
jgi:putative oxidoreductase